MMTQEVLHNQGIIFLNGHFLTVLPRAVFRTQPKVCGRAFFLILATVVFNFFRKKAPPSMFICVPERPMLPVKKKETNYCIILHNYV